MKRLGLFLLLAACGGSGAALHAAVYPGDTVVTGRRLAALARQYEDEVACTEADTIDVTGLAPGTYHVEGCAASRDYTIQCRSRGSGGWGPSETCDWVQFADVTLAAGGQLGCDPDALDVQIVAPDSRLVAGCGYRATFRLDCSGVSTARVCGWVLAGRIEGSATSGTGAGAQGGGGGAYTY